MPETITPDERNARTSGPIHDYLGLTYSNYQVLPRTLMQSMPVEWQERAVAVFEELRAAFQHIEHPECYEVTAAREVEYSELDPHEMELLGVTRADAPDGDDEDADLPDRFYDKDGTEHEGWHRALVPYTDPIPGYNRGRTFIEPRTSDAEAVA